METPKSFHSRTLSIDISTKEGLEIYETLRSHSLCGKIHRNEIKFNDPDITMVNQFRYALGRMTYVVSNVVSDIINNWNLLEENTKELIIKEINKAIEKENIGMVIDKNEWMKIINLDENTKTL